MRNGGYLVQHLPSGLGLGRLYMAKSPVRILVVDDYQPWHRFVHLTLKLLPKLQLIGEVLDGLEAVRKAEELQPDLILLDIGLPSINGIEAARRIRQCAPKSKILFVSENRSQAIAEEALSTGASGYVVKSDAATELLPAVKVVLEGGRFVSASLDGDNRTGPKHGRAQDHSHLEPLCKANAEVTDPHEIRFYPDDAAFVNGFARFLGTTLRNENTVVVIATKSHRASILQRLRLEGVDVDAAIEAKRYVPLDVADSLSMFRFAEHLTAEAVKTAAERNLRVGVG